MFDSIRKRATSWGIVIVFGIIILVFIFSGVGNMGQSGMVVAEVNDEKITVHEYATRLNRFMNQQQAFLQQIKTAADIKAYGLDTLILREMIQERLLEQFAGEMGIIVDDSEILAQIAQAPLFQNADGKYEKKKLEDWLSANKLTWGEFAAEQRKPLLLDKMRKYMALSVDVTPEEARRTYFFAGEERKAQYVLFALSQYAAGIEPGREQVEQFYEANKASFWAPARLDVSSILLSPVILSKNYPVSREEAQAFYDAEGENLFTTPMRYKVSHILITSPRGRTPGKEEEARALAIAEDIKKGADFAEQARAHSMDPVTAPKGGEVGLIEAQPDLLPEYAQTLAALEVGQVSGPVHTDIGYFIIRLDGKEEPRTAPFEEALPQIEERLSVQKALADFEDVRHEAETLLAAKAGLEELSAKFGVEVSESGLESEAKVLQDLNLPAETSHILTGTPAGELVPVPLDTENGFLLVRVNKVSPEGTIPLDELYDPIVMAIKNQEGLILARKAASEAMPAFENADGVPAGWEDKIVTSAPFHRMGGIVGLGQASPLVEALFGARAGEWLNAPYDAEEGVVIARVVEIIPATEEEWLSVKDQMTAGLLAEKQNSVTRFMMESLWNKAKINVNTAAMDQVLTGGQR